MPRAKQTKINILLNKGAKFPTRADDESIGWDLYSIDKTRIPGKGTRVIGTGVKLEMPKNWYATIEERSGFSANTSLGIKAGVIDSGYRGEVKIIIQNISDFPYDIEEGDKIAQMIFHKEDPVTLISSEEFKEPETQRGEKGFGSSGSK